MGHHHSKPDYDGPVDNPNRGGTWVRITVGSHEGLTTSGSIPGVALFTEEGVRIGQIESDQKMSVPGSFRDVAVQHTIHDMHYIRPSYLVLQAGDYDICISAISLHFADGARQEISGDDLAPCSNQLDTHASRTYIGTGEQQPQCFWLYGPDHPGLKVQRVSFHVADFVWSQARREAYGKNKELVCRLTPRLYTQRGGEGSKRTHLDWTIPIFNPPIDYDPKTHFDKDPDRILHWAFDKKHPDRDLSDQPFMLPHSNSKAMVHAPAQQAGPWLLDEVPEQLPKELLSVPPVRLRAPTLVVSESRISAQDQCRYGEWNHTDYVSLSEQIYCDMQSRSMFYTCNGARTENCWNPDTQQLQLGGLRPNGTNLLSAWASTGPLFGYTYPNVFTIS